MMAFVRLSRPRLVAAAAAMVLLCAPPALAAIALSGTAVSDSGRGLDELLPGDLVTLDVTARNDGSTLFVIGISAVGYDEVVADFDSGLVLRSIFNQTCILAPDCFGGGELPVRGGSVVLGPGGYTANTIVEETHPLGPKVPIMQAVYSLGPFSTGNADVGVVSGLVGDAQIRLVFLATGLGQTTIDVGSFFEYGDAIFGHPGANVVTPYSVSITVVPEPSVGILLGLGLMGLSRTRRGRGVEAQASRH